MISLNIEPGVVKTWRDFKKENPPYSISLDGYVDAPPKFDPKGPYVNFDHHRGVDRLATRSTTGQVYLAVKQGLFQTFRKERIPHANIFVNDPDQDVCVAVWLLENSDRYSGQKSGGPLVTKLVQVTDLFDATAGTFPLDPETEIMRERAWIFEPYVEARTGGRLGNMKGPEMRNVIESVGSRINDYVEGRGKQIPVETDYEQIGSGNGWVMIIEKGSEARTAMFSRGINAFVSVRNNGDDSWIYSLGKKSTFIPFPITQLYSVLNRVERIDKKSGNYWGGSEIIGGSPRRTGSRLSPEQLERIINDFLSK